MSTKGAIGIQGLKTSGNELAFPTGTVTRADNCMMPSPGVIQPSRGSKSVAKSIDNQDADPNSVRAAELYQWGEHLFVNYIKSSAYFLALWESWNGGGTYHDLGAMTPPELATLRMKFAQLAQSAYFTTDAGLYGLDKPGNAALPAGMQRPKGMVFIDSISNSSRLIGNPNASGSWLSTNNAVAYRAVEGRKDSNGVVKLSEPTGRLVIDNPADLAMAAGTVVLSGGTVTVTLGAGQTHSFRAGDIVNLTLTGGDVGNFTATNRTFLTVTPSGFTYADPKSNYTNVASVVFTSGFKSVQIVVGLTDDAQAGWFVQLYRTDESSGADIDPGDECFECYERIISSTDISNGYVIITDSTPSSFLGEPLPTNATTGDGPDAGANNKPPLLRDICTWDGRMFGIQVYDRHRLVFRVLGCGAPSGLQNNDVVCINTRVFILGDSTVSPRDLELTTWKLPSQNIVSTCSFMGQYFAGQCPGCSARFEYDGTSPTGEILVDEVGLGGGGFVDNSSGAIDGIYAATTRTSAFADALATAKAVTAASTSRTSNVVTMHAVGHGFAQGQKVMLAFRAAAGAPDANFHPGFKTVASVVDADNFTYAESGSNATMSHTYYVYALTFKSDAGIESVRFSKDGEPDAWPVAFVLGGLPDGASPLRIKPASSTNALIVFLKNGETFRVSGAYPYFVKRITGTAPLVAADSLQEHADTLYGLTTQGVATINESGVGVVGRDIEDDMRALIANINAGTARACDVFAVSYESDRQYQLWVPDGSSEHNSQRAYVYDSMDGQWGGSPVGRMLCGLVFRGLDQLVLGEQDNGHLLLERKTFGGTLYQSFAEEQAAFTVNGSYSNTGGKLNVYEASAQGVSAGDALLVDGGYYRVTGVGSFSNADNSYITVAGSPTVNDVDAMTVWLHRTVTLDFAMEAAGLPGVEKVFRELQLHFGHQLFTQLTVNFSNENDSTPVPVVINANTPLTVPITYPTTVRVDVPEALQRSALLKVSITLAEALSYFRLLGYSATSEASSEKTGR